MSNNEKSTWQDVAAWSRRLHGMDSSTVSEISAGEGLSKPQWKAPPVPQPRDNPAPAQQDLQQLISTYKAQLNALNAKIHHHLARPLEMPSFPLTSPPLSSPAPSSPLITLKDTTATTPKQTKAVSRYIQQSISKRSTQEPPPPSPTFDEDDAAGLHASGTQLAAFDFSSPPLSAPLLAASHYAPPLLTSPTRTPSSTSPSSAGKRAQQAVNPFPALGFASGDPVVDALLASVQLESKRSGRFTVEDPSVPSSMVFSRAAVTASVIYNRRRALARIKIFVRRWVRRVRASLVKQNRVQSTTTTVVLAQLERGAIGLQRLYRGYRARTQYKRIRAAQLERKQAEKQHYFKTLATCRTAMEERCRREEQNRKDGDGSPKSPELVRGIRLPAIRLMASATGDGSSPAGDAYPKPPNTASPALSPPFYTQRSGESPSLAAELARRELNFISQHIEPRASLKPYDIVETSSGEYKTVPKPPQRRPTSPPPPRRTPTASPPAYPPSASALNLKMHDDAPIQAAQSVGEAIAEPSYTAESLHAAMAAVVQKAPQKVDTAPAPRAAVVKSAAPHHPYGLALEHFLADLEHSVLAEAPIQPKSNGKFR